METAAILLNVVLFSGLFTLAAGYFWKDRRCHLLRIVGFLLLSGFFTLEIVRIIEEGKDLWNITFTAFAPPIFLFVAWQEYLSYQWDEDHRSLRWLAGTAWIAGLIYYSFDRIPVLTAGIVYAVAGQTVWLGQMFGYGLDFSVGEIHWDNVPLSVGIDNAPVNIILGCTGIEAIVIFVGAVLATRVERDPWADYRDADHPRFLRLRAMSGKERTVRALLYTTSIIWVGNLIRNVLIIYLVEAGWSFDFVHGDLGKGSSFIILLVLAFVTFNLMPEMLDNISNITELTRRESPEERRRREEEEANAKAEATEDGGEGEEAPKDESEEEAPGEEEEAETPEEEEDLTDEDEEESPEDEEEEEA